MVVEDDKVDNLGSLATEPELLGEITICFLPPATKLYFMQRTNFFTEDEVVVEDGVEI